MKEILETVFTAVLQFLAEEKHVSLDHYFVDGTKIEANANRYTFVLGKAVVKHKAKLQEKVHTLFATIEADEQREEQIQQGSDLAELGEGTEWTGEKLETAIQKLEAQLQEKSKDKPLKNNRGFRRFLLRGLSKVTLEIGWLLLAHNLLKQATTDQKRIRVSLQ